TSPTSRSCPTRRGATFASSSPTRSRRSSRRPSTACGVHGRDVRPGRSDRPLCRPERREERETPFADAGVVALEAAQELVLAPAVEHERDPLEEILPAASVRN